jgi:AraC-like DNA-binding protein
VIVRIRPPSPPLQSLIQYLWYHQDLDWGWQRLLPDGAIELIIDLTDGRKRWADVGRRALTTVNRAWLSGQHSRPIAVESAQGSCMIGVHFRPGGAFPFVRGVVADFNDRVTEMDLLWGRFASAIRDRLLEETDIDRRFAILEDALIWRAGGRLTLDRSLACALDHLRSGPETMTIGKLAGVIGVSQKRLVGLFERQVGLKPKMFSRVMRLQAVLRHVDRTPSTPWSVVAIEHGYVDQAHLINDFVGLTGLTPTQYLSHKGDELSWVSLP